MNLEETHKSGKEADGAERMPVLFIGHGSPLNAIEDNSFSRGWRETAQTLPKPKAILCVSAHWETWGSLVTAMKKPRTIHDFGGFPQALYKTQYPASGSPWLAHEVKHALTITEVSFDEEWGLDHGCWSVLMQMYPDADIPVVQLSLDRTKPPQGHYDLAQELAALRRQGVLILGSGNMVHNLRRMSLPWSDSRNINEPFGLDWAIEASELLKKLIREHNHNGLIHYTALGKAVELAVPTPEHYLPLLYALALQEEDETITFFNDQPIAGSLTMTSLIIAPPG